MIRKILIKRNIYFLLLLLTCSMSAQTWVRSPLSCNSSLIQKSTELKQRSLYRSGGSVTDTLTLGIKGFLDDFSAEGPYPDTAKWLNNYVFINRDLPYAPPTLGVATFDGVNADGYPYNFLASQYSTGKADTLTSKPINLDYPGDTSVFFSFFYQAKGRGNFPDPADSLILEFKTPVTGSWHHVWAKKGLSSAGSDSSWKLIMIPITDSSYLRNGFQFRFSNWATLSGNGDHWHIDYVYLNRNRTVADTIFEDVAFVYNTPSLIQEYTAMPWEQYDSTLYKKSRYTTYIRNNDDVVHSGSFEYKIYDANNIQVNTTYNGGGLNYNPFSSIGYVSDTACAFPPLNYVIPSPLTGKTSYTLEAYLDSSPNDTLPSDTVRHKQIFDNYYAYDDGTAEFSYGLSGYIHAQIAEKFTLNVSDTLRCVDIYFNPQWTNASAFTFTLKVWAANGSGAPGTVLYMNPSIDTPMYNQTGHNQFTRYYLDAPLYLNAGTSFFIGFDQNTSQPINIGVDGNTNSQLESYYNVTGSWSHPPFIGSMMMRAVLGTEAGLVGIEDHPAELEEDFVLFPNPANDRLFIRSANIADQNVSVTIADISGRIVSEKNFNLSEPVDITTLSAGVYFIRMVTETSVITCKFIVAR
jgi:hypothetical protein